MDRSWQIFLPNWAAWARFHSFRKRCPQAMCKWVVLSTQGERPKGSHRRILTYPSHCLLMQIFTRRRVWWTHRRQAGGIARYSRPNIWTRKQGNWACWWCLRVIWLSLRLSLKVQADKKSLRLRILPGGLRFHRSLPEIALTRISFQKKHIKSKKQSQTWKREKQMSPISSQADIFLSE